MSQRAEVSTRNKHYLSKHRFYELKHFCSQYPEWVKARNALDGLNRSSVYFVKVTSASDIPNPTAKCVESREYYTKRIELVERAAALTDEVIAPYIIAGVTENRSYDVLRSQHKIPCCREVYYKLYREFFWNLSMLRQ